MSKFVFLFLVIVVVVAQMEISASVVRTRRDTETQDGTTQKSLTEIFDALGETVKSQFSQSNLDEFSNFIKGLGAKLEEATKEIAEKAKERANQLSE